MLEINWTTQIVNEFLFTNSSLGVTGSTADIPTSSIHVYTYSSLGAFLLAILQLLLNLLLCLAVHDITRHGKPGSPSRGVTASGRHILFSNQALADTLTCVALLGEQAVDRWLVPWIAEDDPANQGSSGRLVCSIASQRSVSSACLIAGAYNGALSLLVGMANGGSKFDEIRGGRRGDEEGVGINAVEVGDTRRGLGLKGSTEIDSQIVDNCNGADHKCSSCNGDQSTSERATDCKAGDKKHSGVTQPNRGEECAVNKSKANGNVSVKDTKVNVDCNGQHSQHLNSVGLRSDISGRNTKQARLEPRVTSHCNNIALRIALHHPPPPPPYSYMFTSSGCMVSAIGVWVLGVLVSLCFTLPVHEVSNSPQGPTCQPSRLMGVSTSGTLTRAREIDGLSTRRVVRLCVEDLASATVMWACLVGVVWNRCREAWKASKSTGKGRSGKQGNTGKEPNDRIELGALNNKRQQQRLATINNGLNHHVTIPTVSCSVPHPSTSDSLPPTTDHSNGSQLADLQVTFDPSNKVVGQGTSRQVNPPSKQPSAFPPTCQYVSTSNTPVECGIQGIYKAVVTCCVCFLLVRLSYTCLLSVFTYSGTHVIDLLLESPAAWLLIDESCFRSLTCLLNPLMCVIFCEDLRRTLPWIRKLSS